jgi:toxoflavin biosynthesis protein ToxD
VTHSRSFRSGLFVICLLGFALGGCSSNQTPQQLSKSHEMPNLIAIPNAIFFIGSTEPEREAAYHIDETAYGSTVTYQQGWYEHELPRQEVRTRKFYITQTPITNFQYAAFINDTHRESPDVDVVDWNAYGVNHTFESTRKYAWTLDGYPIGREDHPVVLVSYEDARAYAQWLSIKTKRYWRLPTEVEWELAARGLDGRAYPWGENFNEAKANTSDVGPHDTMPVGSFPEGASPFGVLDMAGQVYEWTATPGEQGRMVVKGGSWDDRGCGVCRSAARHHRHADIKHTIIGFRLVQEMN